MLSGRCTIFLVRQCQGAFAVRTSASSSRTATTTTSTTTTAAATSLHCPATFFGVQKARGREKFVGGNVEFVVLFEGLSLDPGIGFDREENLVDRAKDLDGKSQIRIR